MLPVWTKSKLVHSWWLPLETETLAGGECKELFSASGRCSQVMKFPYKFEMKRVRVEPPITKHTPMTKHWPRSYLFLLHFEWSSWLWVCQVETYNASWNSKVKGGTTKNHEKNELSNSQNVWKKSMLVLDLHIFFIPCLKNPKAMGVPTGALHSLFELQR